MSHRLTNLRRMDRILYIENGVIFEDARMQNLCVQAEICDDNK